jgi:hypothetical protein
MIMDAAKLKAVATYNAAADQTSRWGSGRASVGEQSNV